MKKQAAADGWAKWIRSEADERALLEGCRFDERRAEHVVEFGRRLLCHTEGEWYGRPFELMDWQRDQLMMPLFGWVQPSEDWGREVRRYKTAFVQVAKKNGKSPTGAYIGLYMLVGDGEKGAKVFSTATDSEEAQIVHDHAVRMVRASPRLSDKLKIHKTSKRITYDAIDGFYGVLAADNVRGKQGRNANCCIADELHSWHGRAMFDSIKYSFISRPEPLFFLITTAGETEETVWYQQREYAAGVASGKVHDLSYFPLIYEADPVDDWADLETWKKANPSMGITVMPGECKTAIEEAKQEPSLLPALKRYRLNIMTSSESIWLKEGAWDECEDTFTEESLCGHQCWAGLDLSKTRDMTALVLVFPWDEGYRILPYFWLPEDTAREKRRIVPFDRWGEAGFIELTPGNTCDYSRVRAEYKRLCEVFDIRECAFDPWNAEDVTQRMEDDTGVPRIEFKQSMANLADPTQEFERLVLAGDVRHAGHPVLSWQVKHCKVHTDVNSNKRPIKPKPDDVRKVDGVVAAIMGLARAQQGEHAKSVYETRGALSV